MNRPDRAIVRASRKLLENPYAHMEDDDERDLDALAVDVVAAPAPLTKPINNARRLLGNQYAHIEELERWESDGNVETSPASKAVRKVNTVSKANFRSLVSEIFLAYVPPHQPRKLPAYQKSFVTRNEDRPGAERYELLVALRRYDLSTTPNVRPQFNRESPSQAFTEQKLREVELSVKRK